MVCVGQVEIDFRSRPFRRPKRSYRRRPTSRGLAGSKRFFPFGPVDGMWRLGDTPLCQLLRCSWFTLRNYREQGLTLDQAERAAEALQCDISDLWPAEYQRIALLVA
jgi:hypothetical protein